MDYTFYLIKGRGYLDRFIKISFESKSIEYELIEEFSFRHKLEDPSYSTVSVIIEDFDDYKNNLIPENRIKLEEFLKRTWLVSSSYGLGNFLTDEQEELARLTEPSYFSIIDNSCAKELLALFVELDLCDIEAKYESSNDYKFEYFLKDVRDWVWMLEQIGSDEYLLVFMG